MNDKPELDKRKAFILATVVYEYINTAEPVGSVTLTQKYNLGVSSATIRNEMAELEAGGYLVQPHTSAGRDPLRCGLPHVRRPADAARSRSKDDARRIRDEFREASRELDDVIDQTTRLLSGLSSNLAIAIAPLARYAHVQARPADLALGAHRARDRDRHVAGRRRAELFEWTTDVDADDLTHLSNALNARFGGKRDGRRSARRASTRSAPSSASARRSPQRVRTAFATARQTAEPEIAAARRAESARPAGVPRPAQAALDPADCRRTKVALRSYRRRARAEPHDPTPHVQIGHELGADEIAECSVVTVPYRFGDRGVGHARDPRTAPHAVRPPDGARLGHRALARRTSRQRRDPVSCADRLLRSPRRAADADESDDQASLSPARAQVSSRRCRRQSRRRDALQRNQRSLRSALRPAEARELRSLRARRRQRRRRRGGFGVRRRGLRRYLRHVLRRSARRRRPAAPQRTAARQRPALRRRDHARRSVCRDAPARSRSAISRRARPAAAAAPSRAR